MGSPKCAHDQKGREGSDCEQGDQYKKLRSASSHARTAFGGRSRILERKRDRCILYLLCKRNAVLQNAKCHSITPYERDRIVSRTLHSGQPALSSFHRQSLLRRRASRERKAKSSAEECTSCPVR